MLRFIGICTVLGAVFFIGRAMGSKKIEVRYKTCDTHYREMLRVLEGRKVKSTRLGSLQP
jgi:hypothetical protein